MNIFNSLYIGHFSTQSYDQRFYFRLLFNIIN